MQAYPRLRPRFRRRCRSACIELFSAIGPTRCCLDICSTTSFIVEPLLLTLFTAGLFPRLATSPTAGWLATDALRPGEFVVTDAASTRTAFLLRNPAASGIVPILEADDTSLRPRFRDCCVARDIMLRARDMRRPNGPAARPSRGLAAEVRRLGGTLASCLLEVLLLPLPLLSRWRPLGTTKGLALAFLIPLLALVHARARERWALSAGLRLRSGVGLRESHEAPLRERRDIKCSLAQQQRASPVGANSARRSVSLSKLVSLPLLLSASGAHATSARSVRAGATQSGTITPVVAPLGFRFTSV